MRLHWTVKSVLCCVEMSLVECKFIKIIPSVLSVIMIKKICLYCVGMLQNQIGLLLTVTTALLESSLM
jgi:hypothetical protein